MRVRVSPPKSSFSATPLALLSHGRALTELHQGALLCLPPPSFGYIKPSSSSLLSFQHPLALASPISACLSSSTREPKNRHCWTLGLLGADKVSVVQWRIFLPPLEPLIFLSINPNLIVLSPSQGKSNLGSVLYRPNHPFLHQLR